MKKILFAISAGALMMVACQNAPEADQAATGEQQDAAKTNGENYTIDANGSTIGWIGTKTGGQHNGNFVLTDGSFVISESKLTGGSFNIDLSSLTVNDLTGEDKATLEGHLKSGDFFLVDSFPIAKFEITKVAAFDSTTASSKLSGATHTISGNLTLRGDTKNVTFPAIVKLEGTSVSALADFNIDRTNWGLNYKGPKNPADWFIAKEVNLKLDVKATKSTM